MRVEVILGVDTTGTATLLTTDRRGLFGQPLANFGKVRPGPIQVV